MSLFIEPAAIM